MTQLKCINAKNCRLIEGHIYDIRYASAAKVSIKNGSSYDKKRFQTLDGSDIKNLIVPYSYTSTTETQPIDETDLGQWVKCRYANGSKLAEGGLYKVVNIEKSKWSTGINISKVKLEGVPNWISAYRFCKLDVKEKRTIKLSKVEKIEINTKIFDRKFDGLKEQDRIKVISKMIADNITEKEKHGYKQSLSELIIMNDRYYGLTKEDLTEYINQLNKIL